jgi:hypothetical protein
MSEDELAAIEARANAATPGPWTDDLAKCGSQQARGEDSLYFQPTGPESRTATQSEADRLFIAHARSDIPALIAEVRFLRMRLDE